MQSTFGTPLERAISISSSKKGNPNTVLYRYIWEFWRVWANFWGACTTCTNQACPCYWPDGSKICAATCGAFDGTAQSAKLCIVKTGLLNQNAHSCSTIYYTQSQVCVSLIMHWTILEYMAYYTQLEVYAWLSMHWTILEYVAHYTQAEVYSWLAMHWTILEYMARSLYLWLSYSMFWSGAGLASDLEASSAGQPCAKQQQALTPTA